MRPIFGMRLIKCHPIGNMIVQLFYPYTNTPFFQRMYSKTVLQSRHKFPHGIFSSKDHIALTRRLHSGLWEIIQLTVRWYGGVFPFIEVFRVFSLLFITLVDYFVLMQLEHPQRTKDCSHINIAICYSLRVF